MQHHRSRIAILTFLLATLTVGGFANAQQKSDQTATAKMWLRQIVQIKGRTDLKTQLKLSAPDLTAVYFNGQRLLKSNTYNEVVAWEIGSLIRNGRNCVSISVDNVEADRSISASLRLANGDETSLPQWKMTTTAPPVGWHKTDFNDRDWKPARKATGTSDFALVESTVLPWAATNTESHIANGRLEFRDGDHVVLLGGTFIERAQQFGHLETALTAATGKHHVTFRNLGWSADTVFAESRGIFDTPAKGYQRMIEHVRAEEPTLILVCYGQNEAMSFAQDESGVERFRNQLKVLHNDLTASGAEVVFLTPHPFVKLAAPLPDATRWNPQLSIFANAVKEVANDLGATAIDLNNNFVTDLKSPQKQNLADGHPDLEAARNAVWTDNGIHWNDAGYQAVSAVVADRLFGRPTAMQKNAVQQLIVVDTSKSSVTATQGEVRKINWRDDGDLKLTFEFKPASVNGRPLRLNWISDITNTPTIQLSNWNASDTDANQYKSGPHYSKQLSEIPKVSSVLPRASCFPLTERASLSCEA